MMPAFPGASRTGPRRRTRGIALLMALAVVMLLSFFMSEYFFATALELRAMGTFKEAQKARVLSRSVFKAVQLALLQDEVDFFTGLRQITQLLDAGGALPWNDGLVLVLDVRPQDHLFNLNQAYNVQTGQPPDVARARVFVQLFDDLEVPSPNAPGVNEPVAGDTVAAIYAALQDWIDGDDTEYTGFLSVFGAENASYQLEDVDFQVKNGMLDRLEEIRPVRGVLSSGIPWAVWENTVTALPKQSGSFYLTERVNVNVASAAEIQRFLESRRVDPNEVGGANKETHDALNALADQAEEIAQYFAPEEGERRRYTVQQIQDALKDLGLSAEANYATNFALSTVNRYYRVRIVTEASEVTARLEAMVEVERDKESRIGTSFKVLWISQN